ncbi:MAG: twin-arginine translocase subunit TatC [Actinomycetota bacterium]|nr:twin-arginine translocase subunit TatC [Actinomycetota bacterium]
MPIGPKRMPFLDHLEEFRKRLVIVVITIAVSSTALYYWSWDMLDIILKPILPYIGKLNVFGPFESFTFRFKVALYGALVLTSPILIWQVLAFFLPALKPKERRYFVPTFIAGVVLFIAGNAFAYYVILDPAFKWMLGQVAGGSVEVLPDASKFLSGVTLLMLGFGLAFELPVVVFYLLLFDFISYKKLRASWRVVYVLLMLVAAIATPDWSPVTMGALFAALIALYEGSLGLARLVLAKRIAQQKAMGL